MSNVHICPVCGGKGTVPPGFYEPITTASGPATCRSCNGRGVFIVRDAVWSFREPLMTIGVPLNPWWPGDDYDSAGHYTEWAVTCILAEHG